MLILLQKQTKKENLKELVIKIDIISCLKLGKLSVPLKEWGLKDRGLEKENGAKLHLKELTTSFLILGALLQGWHHKKKNLFCLF